MKTTATTIIFNNNIQFLENMAWDSLKSAVSNVIKSNNDREITGQVLQNALLNIINALGENATFSGVATPSTSPGVPDGPTYYFAAIPGTYSNFNNIKVDDGTVALLMWDGTTWAKHELHTNYLVKLSYTDDSEVFSYLATYNNLVSTNTSGSSVFDKPTIYTWYTSGSSNILFSLPGNSMVSQFHINNRGYIKYRVVVLNLSNKTASPSEWSDFTTTTTRPGLFSPENLAHLQNVVKATNDYEDTWSFIKKTFIDLGNFDSATAAEDEAVKYASNMNARYLVYSVAGNKSGIITQAFSNQSATVQFLYYAGSRYVRKVSWGNGTKTDWVNITGAERIMGLAFDSSTSKLSLKDALGDANWGSVTLPFEDIQERVDNLFNTLGNSSENIELSESNTVDLDTLYFDGFYGISGATQYATNIPDISGDYISGTLITRKTGTVGEINVLQIFFVATTIHYNSHIWIRTGRTINVPGTPMGKIVWSNWENIDGLIYKVQDIEEALINKVDKDDYAPQLTSGFSDNLVGRGESVDSLISFRPTAGLDSISDGAVHIKRLKGYSIVWNQLAETPYSEFTGQNNTNYRAFGYTKLTAVDTTHKYLALFKASGTAADGSSICQTIGTYVGAKGASFNQFLTYPGSSGDYHAVFFEINDPSYQYFGFFARQPEGSVILDDKNWIFSVQIHDLTSMFNTGNEPSTLSEFIARTPLVEGDYNIDGYLIGSDIAAIKTIGFNAWDEQWEVGGLADGRPTSTTNQIRSKNFCRCAPSMAYYATVRADSPTAGKEVHFAQYDKEKRHIANNRIDGRTVTTLADAAYFKIFTSHSDNYGSVYNNDICVNIVHSGYRNGEYEPYKEYIRPLDVQSIKDSDGTALFPHGLCRAGEVFDEITSTKAIKRVGVVDLGTLTWATAATSSSLNDDGRPNVRMIGKLTTLKGPTSAAILGNVICEKYVSFSADDVFQKNKGISVEREEYVSFSLYDPDYTDPVAFQEAVSGVRAFYELREPIEVIFDEPINLDYVASDFGSEEAIGTDFAFPILSADTVYQFNAVDSIRDLKKLAPQSMKTSVTEADKRFIYKGATVDKNSLTTDVVADVNLSTNRNEVGILTRSWGTQAWPNHQKARCWITGATTGKAGVMTADQCAKLEAVDTFLTKLKTTFGTDNIDTIISKLATLK